MYVVLNVNMASLIWRIRTLYTGAWLVLSIASICALQGLATAQTYRSGPDGLLQLLDRWQAWDVLPVGTLIEELEKTSRNKKLDPPLRAYARTLLANAYVRTGRFDEAKVHWSELGYITKWRVLGPFDNTGKSGLDTKTPAEQKEALDADASVQGKERTLVWRETPDVFPYGYVSLKTMLRPANDACAVAETWVDVKSTVAVALWVGAAGAMKLYWNGIEVLVDRAYRGINPDRKLAIVTPRGTRNRVTIKVCTQEQKDWGFYLRMADAREATGKSAFDVLERRANAEKATAQAHEDFAKYLVYTYGDDAATQSAKQHAWKAIEKGPNLDRIELALGLVTERGEKQRLVELAKNIAPDSDRAHVIEATFLRNGFEPERGLASVKSIPETSRYALDAAIVHAEILQKLNLYDSAVAVLKSAKGKQTSSPSWAQALKRAYEAASQRDRVIEQTEMVLKGRADDKEARRLLIQDAALRHDIKAVTAHLAALDKLGSEDVDTYIYKARVLEGIGKSKDAEAALKRAIELCPDEHLNWLSYGRFLLKNNRDAEAKQALSRALELRPQDADTRDVLSHLQHDYQDAQSFVASVEELKKRRKKTSPYPYSFLQNMVTRTVFANGLSGLFRQVAVQVHSAEGARRWRTYAIQFDPESQRVEIKHARVFHPDGSASSAIKTYEQQLGEPWYRMYYDSRALVIVFPEPRAGDTVEVQYRVDDIAERNVFSDYFGDMQLVGDFVPVEHFEYVLTTPANRKFFIHVPTIKGLRHVKRAVGSQNEDRFVVDHVPAAISEYSSPGTTEVIPYLHVSTYRTWEDVGRWYWGLIDDQLTTDNRIRSIAHQVTKGASSTQDKVRRIYEWVTQNTRYVALEFGIHGYKPYRVTQVVQRGFGDCKDKASLLYAMLKEVGVDTRIVLVRTRKNGDVNELPASLAVFDHVIAYVPELDVYLDGTAENAGYTELPNQDQGVMVLVIGPSSAKLQRTPVKVPDENRRDRVLRANLNMDGSADVDVNETIIGSQAPNYRTLYQAEGTRNSRFERELQGLFNGAHLTNVKFESVNDVSRPVVLSYTAHVPQFAARTPSGLQLGVTTLGSTMRSLARSQTRHNAIDFGERVSFNERIELRLPGGVVVANMPRGGSSRSEFGSFTLDVQHRNNHVVMTSTYALATDRVKAGQYERFRKWIENVDSLLKQRVEINLKH